MVAYLGHAVRVCATRGTDLRLAWFSVLSRTPRRGVMAAAPQLERTGACFRFRTATVII